MPRPQHKDADEELQRLQEVIPDQLQAIQEAHPDQEARALSTKPASASRGRSPGSRGRKGSRPRGVRQTQYRYLYLLTRRPPARRRGGPARVPHRHRPDQGPRPRRRRRRLPAARPARARPRHRHALPGEATGLLVRLPDWLYPVVLDTATGEVHFDNYDGAWGPQEHLDRFLQAYAVEKAKLEARKKGYSVSEQPLEDGSIRLQIVEAR